MKNSPRFISLLLFPILFLSAFSISPSHVSAAYNRPTIDGSINVYQGTSTQAVAPGWVVVQGNYLYSTVDYGLQGTFTITDISNKKNPVNVASMSNLQGLEGIAVRGNYAYVEGYTAGNLQVYDVSHPNAPVLVTTVSGIGGPECITLNGNYAYVCDYSGHRLLTFDISSSSNPVLVNTLNNMQSLIFLAIHNQKLFGTAYNGTVSTGYIYTLDISSSSNPVLTNTATSSSIYAPVGIDFASNYMYVACGWSNCPNGVYDISNPNAPIFVKTFGISDQTFVVSNTTLFGANLITGNIDVFDISSSSNPQSIESYPPASYKSPGWSDDVMMVGNTLFVTTSDGTYPFVDMYEVYATSTLSSPSVTNISQTGLTLTSSVVSDGGASTTARGFNYGLTTAYGTTASETGTFSLGTFSQALTGLTCGTTYHYQSFATNIAGTGHSSDATFSTSQCAATAPASFSSSGSSLTPGTLAYENWLAMLPAQYRATLLSQGASSAPATSVPALSASTTPQSASSTLAFMRDLSLGSVGKDVYALQVFLNAHGYPIAASGAGSPGRETNTFGSKTTRAVAVFQRSNSIKPAVGYVGPTTRATIEKMMR